jgi:AbrB family looped-hinge helix DNA binding protein
MPETILQVKHNGEITLPSIIRDKANLKEGDLLEVVLEVDGTVRLIPQNAVDNTQAYFWTRRWQEGEREVDDDLLNGRFHKFETMNEAVKFLEERDGQG